MADDFWIERAQTAEAKLNTLKQAYEPALERIRTFKANFGLRERDNGEIIIDYEKFVTNLGVENAMELRQVIDEVYAKKKQASK